MSQIDKIRKYIDSIGEGTLFDITEIQEELNFPRPSIRRILGGLVNSGEISRVESGLFRVPERDDTSRFGGQIDGNLVRKYVSGLFYCSNKKRQFFAATFERNDIDRESELLDRLDEEFSDRCSDIRDNYGYSQDEFFESETNLAIYPEIEVGEL